MKRAALALACLVAGGPGCHRRDAAAPEQLEREIAALQKERDELRQRVGDLVVRDSRLAGMPQATVDVGVPTSLARTLIERVLGGVTDQVTLALANLKAHKAGTVKKIVTIGTYDLSVTINQVRGQLRTGKPELRFGGNQVGVALPVEVASGTGQATVHFKWDGRNVSGAVCGDMDVTREVSGNVKPATYPLKGALALSSAGGRILAAPRFPPLSVRLEVEPSEKSWAAVQALLDEKGGVCGYVVDKVDIPAVIRGSLGKGFNVRLPVEKLKPVAIPVGVESQVPVAGRTIGLAVEVGGLAITESTIWLGANVHVGAGAGPSPAASPATAGAAPAKR